MDIVAIIALIITIICIGDIVREAILLYRWERMLEKKNATIIIETTTGEIFKIGSNMSSEKNVKELERFLQYLFHR
jgi:hypothetical protein